MKTLQLKNELYILAELIEAEIPTNPKRIYDIGSCTDRISYKTFYRGIEDLVKKEILMAKKVSNGRGKGVNLLITNIEREEIKKRIEKIRGVLKEKNEGVLKIL